MRVDVRKGGFIFDHRGTVFLGVNALPSFGVEFVTLTTEMLKLFFASANNTKLIRHLSTISKIILYVQTHPTSRVIFDDYCTTHLCFDVVNAVSVVDAAVVVVDVDVVDGKT